MDKNTIRNVRKGTVADRCMFTFVVTENCNLACKYCYEVRKNKKSNMSLETAFKAADFMIDKVSDKSQLVLDFIGGEPLLEIDLIDKVCDYIKLRLYEEKHPWFGNYIIQLSTNGVLYGTEKVQNFIKKNINCLNVSISIDGLKEKHDLQRVKWDGTGSYDDIIKNVPLWIEQFPEGGTKVTFASDDLKFLKDSMIHLNELGIQRVEANVVNEDVWKENDDLIFEEQLKSLADYMIERDLPMDFAGGFFEEKLGLPYVKELLKVNWCNCGENNYAVDSNGNLYPCLRFLPFTLPNKEARTIGNIYTGVDQNLLRPFETLDILTQSNDECLNCEIATGCHLCVGNNYEVSENNSIFNRASGICKMHKARCRANDYYFARLKNEKNKIRFVYNTDRKRFLYFHMSDQSVNYCMSPKTTEGNRYLSYENFKKGLAFARNNFYSPIIVYDNKELPAEYEVELKSFEAKRIKPLSLYNENDNNTIYVVDVNDVITGQSINAKMIQLRILPEELEQLPALCERLFASVEKINLIIDGWDRMTSDELETYEKSLESISELILQCFRENKIKQLDILTDIFLTKEMINCNAGVKSYTLAPTGDFYLCSGFYQNGLEPVGDLETGINSHNKNYKLENSPLCKKCENYQCKRCIYDNVIKTREYNVATELQCRLRYVEKKVSKSLQDEINKINNQTRFSYNTVEYTGYIDPLDQIIADRNELYYY